MNIDVGDIMKSQALIINITGQRRLAAPASLGAWLIRLAGRVIGTNVEIRGPFAMGGYVTNDAPYCVGDFRPAAAGRIVPLGMMKTKSAYASYHHGIHTDA